MLLMQGAVCTQTHVDPVLSPLLEITRNTIQKTCFVSLRILKEALNDLKRNDLNKRTKKKLESEQKFWRAWGWKKLPPRGTGKSELTQSDQNSFVSWGFCHLVVLLHGETAGSPRRENASYCAQRQVLLVDFTGLLAVHRGPDPDSWGFPRHTRPCSKKTEGVIFWASSQTRILCKRRNGYEFCCALRSANLREGTGPCHLCTVPAGLVPTCWLPMVPVSSSRSPLAGGGLWLLH